MNNSNINNNQSDSDQQLHHKHQNYWEKNCDYCHKKNHNKSECKYENYVSQSDEWKEIHEFKIWYYKQQNDVKNKAVISFNQNNADLMIKAKILSTSKKNSDWYLDSCVSFHMISFMKIFTEIRLFDNDSVNAITDQEVKSIQINII